MIKLSTLQVLYVSTYLVNQASTAIDLAPWL